MRKGKTYKRFCKDCEEMFQPPSKSVKHCEECLKKKFDNRISKQKETYLKWAENKGEPRK